MNPVSSSPVVELRGVAKVFSTRGQWPWSRRRTVNAVRALDMVLERGDILGLAGQSGSGKTTLSRLVLGLEEPSAGQVFIEGRRWDHLPESERYPERVHYQYVPQDSMSALDPQQTVLEHVVETLRVLAGLDRDQARREARCILEHLGLDQIGDSLARQLSGGEQRRVTLARVLALRPRLVIADEPSSGLDPKRRREVLEDLLGNLPAGATCVLVTHDMEAVKEWCSRVAIMLDGWLIETFYSNGAGPIHPYSRLLFDPWAHPLPGEMLADSGCPFHPDCSLRVGMGRPRICQEQMPRLQVVDQPQHLVACHFSREQTHCLAKAPFSSSSRPTQRGEP